MKGMTLCTISAPGRFGVQAKRASELPSSPENASKQALLSEEWWASDAGIQAKARWLKFMQQ